MTEEFLDFCKRNKLTVGSDDPQWQAIINNKNTVISAGAGTGKTTVLSFRFLRLVAEKKAKPSEILTITFTRKATSEMKDRIYSLLQEAHTEGFITDEDLDDYASATISTVDGFCSDIVRKNCIHQGIARDFGMLSDTEARELSDAVVDDVIIQNPDFSALFLRYLSVDNIKEICSDISQNILSVVTEFDSAKTQEKLTDYLTNQIDNSSDEVSNAIESQIEEIVVKPEKKQAYINIAEYVKNKSFDELDNILASLGVLARPTADKELRNFVQQRLKDVYIPSLQAINCLSNAELFYNLISQYHKKLCEEKRSRGLLTFNDVMQLTLKILTEDIKQRDYYKKAFKYIMIDEFQDNNDDYRKLLFLLSENSEKCSKSIPLAEDLEKEKIFLVGDQKQSIYKFRGADVSVFKQLSQSLGTKPIELSKNWRSEPYIINFCNDIFARIMSNEQKLEYEADFAPLTVRDKSKANEDGREIEENITLIKASIASSKDYKKEERSKAEAIAVADYIEEICSKNSTCLVPDDQTKELRPPKYGEIGILLRTLSRQTCLEGILNKRRIPFSVAVPKTLMDDALANDFWAAIMTVLYPQDNVVLSSFLKSPFCSVKDKDITKAIALYNQNDCQDERIKAAKDIIEGLGKRLTDNGLCSALTYLWNDCGYRSFILSVPEDRSYSQHFDWLYAIAIKFEQQGKSAVEFTDYIRAFQEGNLTKPDEETVFAEKQDAVQIMTVHKSKGLAFKVVIVYGADQGSANSSFKPHNRKDGGFTSVRFVPEVNSEGKDIVENPLEHIFNSREKMMEDAETKRILYVAATRPKHKLVFSVSYTKPSGKDSAKKMWDYLVYGLDIDPTIDDGLYKRDGYALEVKTYECSEENSLVVRKKPNAAIETFTTLGGIKKAAVTELEKEEVSAGGEKLPALESDTIIDRYNFSAGFGTIVHAIIEESLCGNKAEHVFNEKMSKADRETISKDAKLLASNFLNSSYLESLKNDKAKLFCEKPLLFYNQEENILVEGRIDLLCVTDRAVTIIDFKTDRYRQEEKHRLQLLTYKNAIEKMPEFKGKDILTNVVYLRDKIQ